MKNLTKILTIFFITFFLSGCMLEYDSALPRPHYYDTYPYYYHYPYYLYNYPHYYYTPKPHYTPPPPHYNPGHYGPRHR